MYDQVEPGEPASHSDGWKQPCMCELVGMLPSDSVVLIRTCMSLAREGCMYVAVHVQVVAGSCVSGRCGVRAWS